jgi:hypothetical protein
MPMTPDEKELAGGFFAIVVIGGAVISVIGFLLWLFVSCMMVVI